MANIIDGKELSSKIKLELKTKIQDFKTKYEKDITLAVVLVGDNPASQVYVKNKIKTAEELGINSLSYRLPQTATYDEVESVVKNLANDDNVDGILVQLPLPKGLDEEKILELIPDEKDVDGFCKENLGNLLLGRHSIVSCTPLGVIKMLESINYDFTGKNAVVIGRSNIVGKPLALLLLQKNCTVTVCHSKTKNLKEICANADLVIAAIGKPEFVKGDMIKEGATVIDVGINRTENGLVGDVDFDDVAYKTENISKVPGGVGPMTITMLMENTYNCALYRLKK